MAKTKLRIADRTDIFLYMTRVENLFINEFLPDAPGEYVKVYLFGLMHAQYEEEIDSEMLARTLGMEEFEVEEAWDYWEARGLVRRSRDKETIEFVRMVERFYGKSRVYAEDDRSSLKDRETAASAEDDGEGLAFDDEDVSTYYDFDSLDEREEAAPAKEKKADDPKRSERSDGIINYDIRDIFEKFQEVSGRTVSRKETEKLTDAIKVYGINPEVLSYAIDYCADIDNYNTDYIFKVALRWKEDGCEDAESARALVEKHSARNKAYREVFKAVGFSRLTTPADREIMDRWFDELGFSLEEVLDACRATGGIREPSLRYVNKVLENSMLEKGGVNTSRMDEAGKAGSDSEGAKVSRKVLREYFEHIREEEENALAERLRSALSRVPGLEEVLDKETELNQRAINLVSGANSKEKREQMREDRKSLEQSKRSLLVSAGYPEDYLERRYRCNICKDTGYTDEGSVCTCCRARADEAYMWNLERNKS